MKAKTYLALLASIVACGCATHREKSSEYNDLVYSGFPGWEQLQSESDIVALVYIQDAVESENTLGSSYLVSFVHIFKGSSLLAQDYEKRIEGQIYPRGEIEIYPIWIWGDLVEDESGSLVDEAIGEEAESMIRLDKFTEHIVFLQKEGKRYFNPATTGTYIPVPSGWHRQLIQKEELKKMELSEHIIAAYSQWCDEHRRAVEEAESIIPYMKRPVKIIRRHNQSEVSTPLAPASLTP